MHEPDPLLPENAINVVRARAKLAALTLLIILLFVIPWFSILASGDYQNLISCLRRSHE